MFISLLTMKWLRCMLRPCFALPLFLFPTIQAEIDVDPEFLEKYPDCGTMDVSKVIEIIYKIYSSPFLEIINVVNGVNLAKLFFFRTTPASPMARKPLTIFLG